ncbi:MAG: hypothetical protein KDE31_38460, partial [Caldilineaceae bacterium]|nr:hypothetical protein [Caldilineaceae bacterium]
NSHSCGFNRCYDRTAYGKLAITLHAYFQDRLIMTRALTYNEQVIGTCSARSHCSITYNNAINEASSQWEQGRNLKTQFEGGSSAHPPSDGAQLLQAVTLQVEQHLQQEQQRLYSKIIDGFDVGPLQVAAKRLSGAKAILSAFIALGLPRALERDETLRSALQGTDRILDQDAEERIAGFYTAAFLAPPTHNIRGDLLAELTTRFNTLHKVTRDYLDRINAQWYVESHRLIETTLNRLTLAHTLIHTTLPEIDPDPPTPEPEITVTPIPPNAEKDATIYVAPASLTLRQGTGGSLSIMVNPGETPINGVQIHGKIDSTSVKITGIHPTDGLPVILDAPRFDAATGTFSYSAGILNQVIREPIVLLTLDVQGVAPTGGQGAAVKFLTDYPPTNVSGPQGDLLRETIPGRVIVTGESTGLHGIIELQGRPAKPNPAWAIPLQVQLFAAGA